MKRCPYCAEEIQDEAIKCRYCGEFLDDRERPRRNPAVMFGYGRYYWGYEYRSRLELFGWPLIHIAQGIDPDTGRPRVARGVIAIGNLAIGLLALGGIAVGGLAIGGLGLGVFALGGIALALYLAAGGMAFSLMYAIGGLAIAPHAISSVGADPEFVEQLEKWWPGVREAFRDAGR